MKYIHIMPNEKFTEPFIKFIKNNFLEKEHLFIILDSYNYSELLKDRYMIIQNKKKLFSKYKIYIIMIFYMILGKKIIFHSLFNRFIIVFLFFNKWILKKSNWVIWGGDLYCYKSRKKKLLIQKIYYKLGDYVKGNMAGYITHIKGDYKLAQKWYGAHGNYYDCFVYVSNLYNKIEIEKKEKKETYIQIGNSADPSNNHLEILEKLEKFKNQNIKLFCILSYGDRKWAQKVTSYGKKIFGEKFIPIIDFMKYDEYIKFISQIDIAIFAHDRQQACGNITSLLGMGKTIYLKKNVTTYETLKELNLHLFNFNELKSLETLSDEEIRENKKIIEKRFSVERLKTDLSNIFNS